jgi:hypothetical protein
MSLLRTIIGSRVFSGSCNFLYFGFRVKSFFLFRMSTLRQSPAILVDQFLLAMVFSLNWQVSILNRRKLALRLCMI